jgi:hypothetical protein
MLSPEEIVRIRAEIQRLEQVTRIAPIAAFGNGLRLGSREANRSWSPANQTGIRISPPSRAVSVAASRRPIAISAPLEDPQSEAAWRIAVGNPASYHEDR